MNTFRDTSKQHFNNIHIYCAILLLHNSTSVYLKCNFFAELESVEVNLSVYNN